MAFYSTYFTDLAGLQDAIAQTPYNDFINKSTGQRGADPLSLLFPNSSYTYALRVRDDDGLIVASASFSPSYNNPSAIVVGQVSVRDGEKRQGHGRAMLHAIFKAAQQQGKTLIMTPFEHEGAICAPAVAETHQRDYPSVPVIYDGQAQPVDGYRRYTLRPTAIGLAPVRS